MMADKQPPRDGDALGRPALIERLTAADRKITELNKALSASEQRVRSLQLHTDSRDAALREARAEINDAGLYLRNIFREAAPQCEPFVRLQNLCTQIDNLVAGQRQEIERLEKVADDARDALCVIGAAWSAPWRGDDGATRERALIAELADVRASLRRSLAAPAPEDKAAAERAAIVAWLDDLEELGIAIEECDGARIVQSIKNAIERGEHVSPDERVSDG